MKKSMASVMDNIKSYILKTSESPADMLFYTSILGWILSSVAQVGAIVCNEKLSKKEKSFLVPQEFFDGVLNVGIYALVTVNALKFAKEKFKNNPKLNFKGDRYVAPAVTITSIAAGAIASNIITPIARNYLGAVVQKKYTSSETYDKKSVDIAQMNKVKASIGKNSQVAQLNKKFLYPTTMSTTNNLSI